MFITECKSYNFRDIQTITDHVQVGLTGKIVLFTTHPPAGICPKMVEICLDQTKDWRTEM